METQNTVEEGTIRVKNVGGIEETEVTFSPGVTVLIGRNATNRTSFLKALMAVLGSDRVSIKGDAQEADIELTIDGERYHRHLERADGSVRLEGDPYLEDSTVTDLFAFLLETNEARQAVTRDESLRELVMRPVDTNEIQREIDRLVRRRQEIESELEDIESLKNRLPKLETQRTELQSEIEDKQAELEAKEAELESADADIEESREEQDELEAELDELRNKRQTLEDVRYELDTERERLEALESEQNELEREREELPETPVGDIDRIESRIDDLRDRKQSLESEITELQSIVQFNEDMLEDPGSNTVEPLDDETSERTADELASQLVADGTVTCWTCGSEVERERIDSTIDHLREHRKEKLEEVNELQDRIDDLKDETRALRQNREERERIDRRLRTIETELTEGNERIAQLQDRRDELTEEIATIEEEVGQRKSESYDEILDLHKEANQIEYDIGQLESDLEGVEDEIATIEERLHEEEDLEAEREDIGGEITDLRSRIERIERTVVEEFNEHMDTMLELLDYDNLERIWLERVKMDVREGRRKVEKSVFELHVVRSTSSGTTYEDTVEHLSESEREVTGLMFALAGYLANEVHDTIPFMLLDSVEALDSERIARLVEHLKEYTDYLIVALLPEDAAALDDTHRRVADL